MNISKLPGRLLFLTLLLFVSGSGFAQITSDADDVIPTEYSNGPQDSIYIFCGAKDEKNAWLTATIPNGEAGTFEWLKYDIQSGEFIFPYGLADNKTPTISNLENGCYRVNITASSGEKKTYTTWVFNNFIEAKAEITGSDCNSFTLNGTFEKADLTYIDLTTEQTKALKTIKVSWKEGNSVVYSFATYQNFNPPTKDTDYTFEVDWYGCIGKAEVRYISIVTKASFDYKIELQGPGKDKRSDINKNEAPLTVTFTNTSKNGDTGIYEWFIFKDIFKIRSEKDAGTFKDSIMEVLYNDSPVYTFEEIGKYKVKLVSKKVSEFTICTDTFYIKDFIVADSSFIDAPNFFTPDGNGINDKFVVKFFSMKSVKITILNRWGKVIHKWESNNVRGFVNTAEGVTESVWDGKVGGRVATPGVYYYVVEGIGRDGETRKANGFFHLFRDK